jgi:CheY-like chemotaxis protein
MPDEPEVVRPLYILHVEDNQADSELVGESLARGGLPVELLRVDTKDTFLAGLKRRPLDLILCDYQLPQFHGLSALELARAHRPDVPFIFVSGVLGDDLAAETLRQGAVDYLLKDRLARLVPAVRRALKEAKIRSLVSQPPPRGQGDAPTDSVPGQSKES